MQSLKQKGFDTEIFLELPTVAPVWFWLWDSHSEDNRGQINLHISARD